MHRTVPFTLLLLAACSVPLSATVPPEEAALRRPENRAGVLIEGELVRLTWLPHLDPQRAAGSDPAAFAGITGSHDRWLVASSAEGDRALLSFAGRPDAWRQGLLGLQENLLPALVAARNGSSFHSPVPVQLGAEHLWAIGDLVPTYDLRPAGESLATVELYDTDPRQGVGGPINPQLVLVVARRGPSGDEVRRDLATRGIMLSRPGGFFNLARVERTPEGRLTAVEFTPWRADLRAVIGGQVARDVVGTGHPRELAMERLLGDALLEWKTRDLPAWLTAATPAKLDEAIIEAEKGMLQLDLKSRLLKDEIDAAARQGAGSQPELIERAQLIDQRKTLIGVVLGSFKTARAQLR